MAIQSFKHQDDALEKTGDKEYAALLLEMGLGKSRIVLKTAQRLFEKGKINGLIIVAPKSICRTWLEEQIPTHLECKYETVIWGPTTKKLEEQLYSVRKPVTGILHIIIVNVEAVSSYHCYDILHDFLKSHNALMAVDESSTIKNYKAKRTKALIKLGREAKFRRILTGTPVTQGPLDVYSQFDFLKFGCLGSHSWFGFRNQYAVLKKCYINGRSFWEVIGYKRLQELQERIDRISYRATKAECLDLPAKIYTIRYVDMTNKQIDYYEQMRDEALVIFKNNISVAAPLAITQILRLRQSLVNLVPAGEGLQPLQLDEVNPRMDELMDVLREAGNQKVIIFANFVKSIKDIAVRIKKEFGREAGVIHGEIDAQQRQDYISDFQTEPDCKELVMQVRTGGYGITATAASVVVYYDHDWSLETRLQSEDRAHRIGQTRNVTYVDFVARGTVEEKIREALVSKKDLADIVTGDKMRQLLEA